MTSHPDLPVPIGETVDGKYRVERLIGAGGMGCVVEATHLHLLQRVALKFLLAREVDPDAATRLVREARAAVALRSDHVARVLDVGALPNGMPYLVMELLEGQTLAHRIAGGRQLEPDEARAIAIQACRALGEAHRRGIVHRDVKPANIFLALAEDAPYRVKVLDFGIAKVADPGIAVEPGLTSSEHALGTPRYMAPEQLSASRDVDARADVWAMGVVLYEMLVGAPPFSRGTAYEVGAQILSNPAPRVSSLRIGVPPDLDDAIARCLDRDLHRRFVDANELLATLEGRAPSHPSTQLGLGPSRLDAAVDLPPTRIGIGPTPHAPQTLPHMPPTRVQPAIAPVTALPAQSPSTTRVAFVAAIAVVALAIPLGYWALAKRAPAEAPAAATPETTPAAPLASVAPPPAATTNAEPPAAPPMTKPTTTTTGVVTKRPSPTTKPPLKRPPNER